MEASDRHAGGHERQDGLSGEQQRVIDLVLEGRSVFVTGAAGTGKSFLLKKLHQELTEAGKGSSTFMTGTTGKAAVGIGGCTLHSFAGIGLGELPAEELAKRAQKNRYARSNWAECSVLVIDEVSMMSADLFEKLDVVGKRLRGSDKAFGGVQLVLCGDFFQLPPVRGDFCFNAGSWDGAVQESVVLTQAFRQMDPLFLRILHEVREGRVSEEHELILQGQKVGRGNGGGGEASSPSPYSGGGGKGGGGGGGGEISSAGTPSSCSDGSASSFEKHTRLFSTKKPCEEFNQEQLGSIRGPSAFFDAYDSGPAAHLRHLENHCPAEQRLELKVGAKVLLVRNLDSARGLVNGATGVVTEFVAGFPKVHFEPVESLRDRGGVSVVIYPKRFTMRVGNREVAAREQLPLRLGWALTVHKSQGMTLKNVVVSMFDMFADGQAYVALSRTTTLEGLHLLDFDASKITADPSVAEFYARLGPQPQQQPQQRDRTEQLQATGPGVYVLELEGGRFYVGKSETCVAARIKKHHAGEGKGAAFTQRFKVLRRIPTVTTREGSLKDWERAETLELAHRQGIDKVRGSTWANVDLKPSQQESFAEHVVDHLDLCYRCGGAGHMVRSCPGGAKACWMGSLDNGSGGTSGGTSGSSAGGAAGVANSSKEASPATGVAVVASSSGSRPVAAPRVGTVPPVEAPAAPAPPAAAPATATSTRRAAKPAAAAAAAAPDARWLIRFEGPNPPSSVLQAPISNTPGKIGPSAAETFTRETPPGGACTTTTAVAPDFLSGASSDTTNIKPNPALSTISATNPLSFAAEASSVIGVANATTTSPNTANIPTAAASATLPASVFGASGATSSSSCSGVSTAPIDAAASSAAEASTATHMTGRDEDGVEALAASLGNLNIATS